MMEPNHKLPIMDEKMLRAWLAQVNPDILYEQGWQTVNAAQHGLALAAREFANMHYAGPPSEQAANREGFFTGVTFAMLAMLRASDIETISAIFAAPAASTDFSSRITRTQPETEDDTATANGEYGGDEAEPHAA